MVLHVKEEIQNIEIANQTDLVAFLCSPQATSTMYYVVS